MRVPFHQTKNGSSASTASVMNRLASVNVSSSTVSIRLRVSGPVSSMRWVPSGLAQEWITPRGPNCSRKVLPFASTISPG